jgi:hypothetical protein
VEASDNRCENLRAHAAMKALAFTGCADTLGQFFS